MANTSTPSILLAILIFVVSFAFAFVGLRLAIPLLKRRMIVGKDMHKPDLTEVPEMGGLLLVAGFTAGILTIIAANTFLNRFLSINIGDIFAVLSVVLIMVLIGVIDDLMNLRQGIKAVLPLFAAIPLVAVRAGETTMGIPLIGAVDFGIVYSLVLIPLGITGAANAVNMLAGFNGQETGTGLVAVSFLAAIAYMNNETSAFLMLLAAIAALLATLFYNWYPAKVFIGDVGTLSIGAIISSAVIIGNMELAGVIVIIPYAIEFLIKARNRFPSRGWWLKYEDGKLYCTSSSPKGLGQLLAKVAGGMTERNIVLSIMGFETVFGAFALWAFCF